MPDHANDVVVTGLGVVSAIGIGKDAFWKALCAGASGIVHQEADNPPCRAPIAGFTPRDYIRSPHLRRADDLSRTIVAAARLALEDAALGPDTYASDRTGVVVGSAIGNVRESVPYLERLLRKGPALASPMTFPNLVHNAAASYVAMELASTGINLTIAEAEISGEKALALAADTIRSGRAGVVVAGGGDDFLVDIVSDAYGRFGLLAGTSGRSARCSPYDRQRGGIALGQGAAMLVLEPYESARRRGAPMYARLRGYLERSVAATSLMWPPNATSAYPAVRRFLATLGNGLPVDLVIGSANGSGSPDRCELDLVTRAVATHAPLWLTSIKGAVGEFGAAGALAAVASCMGLRQGVVPPLCNLRQADSTSPVLFCAGQSRPAPIQQAVTLGIARGGGLAMLLWDRPAENR